MPLCPPQIPHAARTRTQAAAVGSQRLTTELRHGLGSHLLDGLCNSGYQIIVKSEGTPGAYILSWQDTTLKFKIFCMVSFDVSYI
jgi:hypothetical protein